MFGRLAEAARTGSGDRRKRGGGVVDIELMQRSHGGGLQGLTRRPCRLGTDQRREHQHDPEVRVRPGDA